MTVSCQHKVIAAVDCTVADHLRSGNASETAFAISATRCLTFCFRVACPRQSIASPERLLSRRPFGPLAGQSWPIALRVLGLPSDPKPTFAWLPPIRGMTAALRWIIRSSGLMCRRASNLANPGFRNLKSRNIDFKSRNAYPDWDSKSVNIDFKSRHREAHPCPVSLAELSRFRNCRGS